MQGVAHWCFQEYNYCGKTHNDCRTVIFPSATESLQVLIDFLRSSGMSRFPRKIVCCLIQNIFFNLEPIESAFLNALLLHINPFLSNAPFLSSWFLGRPNRNIGKKTVKLLLLLKVPKHIAESSNIELKHYCVRFGNFSILQLLNFIQQA